MPRSKYRRYKKDYANLFDDPTGLFPDLKVRLWCNGEPCIIISNLNDTQSVIIRAGSGPAGMGVRLSTPIFGPKMTVFHDQKIGPGGTREFEDTVHKEIVIYKSDEWSQRFKKCVTGEGPHPDDTDNSPNNE